MGLYHISGGSLNARAMIIGRALEAEQYGTGTFQVTGSEIDFITLFSTAYPESFGYRQYAGGTLIFEFDEGGVTPITGGQEAIFEDGATLVLRAPEGLYIEKDTVFTLLTAGAITDNGLVLDEESAEVWEFFIEDNTLKAKFTGLRPEITEFTVTGDTASELYTRTAQVDVVLTANPSNPEGTMVGWMVTETDYAEPPAVDDPNWELTSPTTAPIGAAPGSVVTLYAWVIDSDGQASKAEATILYQPQDPVISNLVIEVIEPEGIDALVTWTTQVPAYGNISTLSPGYDEWVHTEIVGPTSSHSAIFYRGLPDDIHQIVIRCNATTLEITWPFPDVVYPTGDANQDCMVDLLDLVYVRNQLFTEIDENNATADVNEDEAIDLQDLIEVRNNLGAECEEES